MRQLKKKKLKQKKQFRKKTMIIKNKWADIVVTPTSTANASAQKAGCFANWKRNKGISIEFVDLTKNSQRIIR